MMMNSQQPQRTYPLAVYPPLAPPTPLAISNSMSPHGITLSSSQSAALCCASSTATSGYLPQQQCDSLFQQQQHGKTTTNSITNEIWNLYQQLNYQENEAIQRILSEGLNIELLNENLKKIENILSQKTDTIRQYMNEDEVSTSPVLPVPVLAGGQSKSIIPKIPQIRPAEELSGFVRNINSGSSILIEDQPYGNVVANKYLEPPLRVKVSEEFNLLAKEGSLQVTAVLCGSLTETRINRTSDGKQNILQGYTILPITPEGYATFNKLKIMDVSSKHHHQPFSIQLQLQEIKKTGSVMNIGDPIKSAPLRVQSRINKKGTATSSSSSSARSNIFNLNNKSNKKKSRTDLDCNYIDITSLLVLPQKEAASKLGISESMLCKRFKECTRRKWPYRYLRKIDKMLQMFSPKSGYFAAGACTEDQEKIERLKREREECLQPVKIRITGNDKVSVKLQSMILTKSDGAIMSETESEEGSSFISSQDQEEVEIHSFEDDEISQVAETLNSLKQPTLAV